LQDPELEVMHPDPKLNLKLIKNHPKILAFDHFITLKINQTNIFFEKYDKIDMKIVGNVKE
jgi:hypothetical protein